MVAASNPFQPESLPPELTPLMLNVKQVASLLCVSERQVYRMADGGLMPRPLKLGGLNRWPRLSVEAWVNDGAKPVKTPGKRAFSIA